MLKKDFGHFERHEFLIVGFQRCMTNTIIMGSKTPRFHVSKTRGISLESPRGVPRFTHAISLRTQTSSTKQVFHQM